jgi:hypothetical protein
VQRFTNYEKVDGWPFERRQQHIANLGPTDDRLVCLRALREPDSTRIAPSASLTPHIRWRPAPWSSVLCVLRTSTRFIQVRPSFTHPLPHLTSKLASESPFHLQHVRQYRRLGPRAVSGTVAGALCAIYVPAKGGVGYIAVWAQMSWGTRAVASLPSLVRLLCPPLHCWTQLLLICSYNQFQRRGLKKRLISH